MSLDVINVSGGHASVTVRGFSPAELRRRAALDCGKVFGRDGDWRFTQEQIVKRATKSAHTGERTYASGHRQNHEQEFCRRRARFAPGDLKSRPPS